MGRYEVTQSEYRDVDGRESESVSRREPAVEKVTGMMPPTTVAA